MRLPRLSLPAWSNEQPSRLGFKAQPTCSGTKGAPLSEVKTNATRSLMALKPSQAAQFAFGNLGQEGVVVELSRLDHSRVLSPFARGRVPPGYSSPTTASYRRCGTPAGAV